MFSDACSLAHVTARLPRRVSQVLMFSAFIVLILLDVAGVFRLGVPAAAVIAAMPILLVRAIGNDEQLDLAKLVDW